MNICLKFINKYIYGFLIKERLLSIFVKDTMLLQVLTIMKKNEIISAKALLDIAVVDLLNSKKNGRFILNYVF